MSRSLRTTAERTLGALGTPLLYAAAAVVLGMAGIHRAFEDGEDRKDALEEDRQGLGLSRERRGA